MPALALRGCFTALVTPFVADGSAVDWDAHDRLIESQIAGGVSGLVPCGTTAEAPTLSDSEQREIVQRTVRLARGRAAVVAGTGSNSTKKTIEASRAAFEAGADAVMIVMPYYSKPSQDGLLRHIELVSEAVKGPIVLYNVPGRTAVDLRPETLERAVARFPNVVGLKDASNNVLYCQSIAHLGARFTTICGDDALTVPLMSVGATGVISVTANLYPREVSDVVSLMLAGNWTAARDAHLKLVPVHAAMFTEPSPSPIKAALAARGRMNDTVRAPLVEMSDDGKRHLLAVLDAYEGR